MKKICRYNYNASEWLPVEIGVCIHYDDELLDVMSIKDLGAKKLVDAGYHFDSSCWRVTSDGLDHIVKYNLCKP